MNNYFPHDSNARNSDKLLPVRMKYGAEGYGIYFMILERLREEKNYMSVKDYNMLAFDLRVDTSTLKDIVENFGLFAFTHGAAHGECFYSEGFAKRMEIKDEKSKIRSEAGKKAANKRWGKKDNANRNANALPTHNEPKAFVKENHAKETKVKETKVNKTKEMHAARAEISKLYQEKIRPMDSPQNIDRVQSFLEDGVALEVILCAIKLSHRDGGHSSGYVVAKLNDWMERGVKSLEDAKEADEAWKATHSFRKNEVQSAKKHSKAMDRYGETLYTYYQGELRFNPNLTLDEYATKKRLNERDRQALEQYIHSLEER